MDRLFVAVNNVDESAIGSALRVLVYILPAAAVDYAAEAVIFQEGFGHAAACSAPAEQYGMFFTLEFGQFARQYIKRDIDSTRNAAFGEFFGCTYIHQESALFDDLGQACGARRLVERSHGMWFKSDAE